MPNVYYEAGKRAAFLKLGYGTFRGMAKSVGTGAALGGAAGYALGDENNRGTAALIGGAFGGAAGYGAKKSINQYLTQQADEARNALLAKSPLKAHWNEIGRLEDLGVTTPDKVKALYKARDAEVAGLSDIAAQQSAKARYQAQIDALAKARDDAWATATKMKEQVPSADAQNEYLAKNLLPFEEATQERFNRIF